MELNLEYQKISPVAQRFKQSMVDQISELIRKNNISLGVPIESRVKSLSSIENKVFRKSKSIQKLSQLDDFVGIRLILLFKTDVDLACDLIAKNFEVLELEDTSHRLADNEFGYQSNHLIIEMPGSWLTVPSFVEFNGFKVEVQIRTLSQHIWAAASHKLQYKSESSVPGPLKRSIHRASALLETVDLELQRLLEQRTEYIQQQTLEESNSDTINVDILENILDEALPRANKLESGEDLSDLLQELIMDGFETPDEIKALIDKHIRTVLSEDRKRANNDHDDPEEIERAKMGVFFTHAGLVRGCMELAR
ncbi:RelA/SpoT domain-containing protein [Pseudidiomarina gelatinasegens]|uniref:GTP pyrophosphokinase n=1 Tax=Pseudidiomarina gelatinasegens TaxID=2487740 RepID=UPI0030ED0221|tara:strand:+ start:6086 stop:7012 length:927 start_codon:yes stop_codon:yes gene_type:complete